MRFLSLVMVCGCVEYGVKDHFPVGAGAADTGGTPEGEPPESDTPEDDSPEDDTHPPRPDDFALGWHILDEGDWVSTTTSASHAVTDHGDTDSYWYEPSGQHGLLESTSVDEDFERMRAYVVERVPEPTHMLGNLHYYADSSVETFSFATFTYVLCDFYVEAGDDPHAYSLTVGAVDDGIEVIVNGAILGFLGLDEGGQIWDLGDHIQVGGRNTLIVILVDNAERNKFIQDMAFYRGDIMVTGSPSDPPPGG